MNSDQDVSFDIDTALDTFEPKELETIPGQQPRDVAPSAKATDEQTAPISDKLQEDLKVSYEASGILDITQNGYGFLRKTYETNPVEDIYVSSSQIRRFWLRQGDEVEGLARRAKPGERFNSLLLVKMINGKEVTEDDSRVRPQFDQLTSLHPNRQIKLETTQDVLSTRITDLVAPIGFGQRALIVSQPKAGKTTFLKEIAEAITANYPEAFLMAILIGERPEEVTEIKRFIKGEVAASHFDEPPVRQVKVANLALERAKRMVESGKDVIILLDSITRLARAFNMSVGEMEEDRGRGGRFGGRNQNGGRYGYQNNNRFPQQGGYGGGNGGSYGRSNRGSLSGGFDAQALFPAKKFLGAARNCEEGGSLTIIGTALVGTESRQDDLIYEEFKGTGNMEVHLDRKFAEKRIFPAVNIPMSGTRHEELLFSEETYPKIITLRRMISLLTPEEALSSITDKLKKTATNQDFLDTLNAAK